MLLWLLAAALQKYIPELRSRPYTQILGATFWVLRNWDPPTIKGLLRFCNLIPEDTEPTVVHFHSVKEAYLKAVKEWTLLEEAAKLEAEQLFQKSLGAVKMTPVKDSAGVAALSSTIKTVTGAAVAADFDTDADGPTAPIMKQIQVRKLDHQPDRFYSNPADHYLPTRSLSVFGGQLIAQAILSAYQAGIDDRLTIHSLHSTFIDRTEPAVMITYKVDRIRSGKNIAVRGVQAFQKDRLVYTALISFHKHEESPVIEYDGAFPSEFPGLNTMTPVKRSDYYQMIFRDGMRENDAILGDALSVKHEMPKTGEAGGKIIDLKDFIKTKHRIGPVTTGSAKTTIKQWLKIKGTLPRKKHHAAAFGMASDAFSTQFGGVLLPHNSPMSWMTSLDHVIYFHRPFDVTKWMAVENVVSVASGGRALIEMKYWNEDGQLVATVLQEGLFRGKSKPAQAKL